MLRVVLRCLLSGLILLPTVLLLTTGRVPATADETSEKKEGLSSNPPAVFAIINAKLVLNPDQTIERGTLIVRHGKIEAVGADVAVPADARVIDLSGKVIYPGFIDAYSEQALVSDALLKTARYWNANVTPQLSVAGQLEDSSTANDGLRKQGLVARLIAPADGIIRGQSALISTANGTPNTTLIARDVAQHIELTVARRLRSGYPGSPMGAVALARQAMYDAQWYRDAWKAANARLSTRSPGTNDALKALVPVVDGQMPVIVETSSEVFLLRAEKFAAEFGLNLIVRGSGREYRLIDEVKATGRTIILPVAFPSAPNVATIEAAEEVTLETMMHWDNCS